MIGFYEIPEIACKTNIKGDFTADFWFFFEKKHEFFYQKERCCIPPCHAYFANNYTLCVAAGRKPKLLTYVTGDAGYAETAAPVSYTSRENYFIQGVDVDYPRQYRD